MSFSFLGNINSVLPLQFASSIHAEESIVDRPYHCVIRSQTVLWLRYPQFGPKKGISLWNLWINPLVRAVLSVQRCHGVKAGRPGRESFPNSACSPHHQHFSSAVSALHSTSQFRQWYVPHPRIAPRSSPAIVVSFHDVPTPSADTYVVGEASVASCTVEVGVEVGVIVLVYSNQSLVPLPSLCGAPCSVAVHP